MPDRLEVVTLTHRQIARMFIRQSKINGGTFRPMTWKLLSLETTAASIISRLRETISGPSRGQTGKGSILCPTISIDKHDHL